MEFTVTKYVEQIAARLAQMPAHRAIIFAAWCTQALWDEAHSFLQRETADATRLSGWLDEIWQYAVARQSIKTERLEEFEVGCNMIDWSEDDVGNDDMILSFCAIEMLNSFLLLVQSWRDDCVLSAARTAECIFNRIDFELSQKYGESYTATSMQDESLQLELRRQQRMLDYLTEEDAIAADVVRLFRDEATE